MPLTLFRYVIRFCARQGDTPQEWYRYHPNDAAAEASAARILEREFFGQAVLLSVKRKEKRG